MIAAHKTNTVKSRQVKYIQKQNCTKVPHVPLETTQKRQFAEQNDGAFCRNMKLRAQQSTDPTVAVSETKDCSNGSRLSTASKKRVTELIFIKHEIMKHLSNGMTVSETCININMYCLQYVQPDTTRLQLSALGFKQ